MKNKLKPCPFCGNTSLDIIKVITRLLIRIGHSVIYGLVLVFFVMFVEHRQGEYWAIIMGLALIYMAIVDNRYV